MDTLDDDILRTPIGFAEQLLRLPLYWWQDQALAPLEMVDTTRVKVACVAPNGSGKSERIVATAVTYWLSIHPKGRVVVTTKDSRQLDAQIWPALHAHKGRYPDWKWIEREIHTPTGGFCITFTTDDAGRAEGWHRITEDETGYTPGPLLIIVDEGKSVPDKIYEAIDRCSYNALLLVSSPGLMQGRFFDAHTKPSLGFITVKAGLKDCPHIPKERIDDIITTYGIDHPFTRSTLFGEFMELDAESQFIIPRSSVRMLMETPPAYEHGEQFAFCDFAAGGAENVLAHRIGNKVLPLLCWRDLNPVSAVGRFIVEFRKRKLEPSQTYGDGSGMGKVIIPVFHEMGWMINPVENGAQARNPVRYFNLGAEMWFETGSLIQRSAIILPDDEILTAQLCSRKINTKTLDAKGRLRIETKDDMIKRGLVSPDRADAVVGVATIESTLISTLFDPAGLRRLESLSLVAKHEEGSIERAGESLVYHNISSAPWLTVWERPTPGLSYLGVLNPAKHGEADKDHTFFMLREGYTNNGETRNLRLVARMSLPCKLDAGPLAEMIFRICQWYGEPTVVPVNHDRGHIRGDVIDALMAVGIPLYRREDFEHVRHGTLKTVEWGWETTKYTRSLWISALAEAIRSQVIDVECRTTVTQLYGLSSENSETMRDAEALGVGLKCIGYSSRYQPRENNPLRDFGLRGQRRTVGAMASEIS